MLMKLDRSGRWRTVPAARVAYNITIFLISPMEHDENNFPLIINLHYRAPAIHKQVTITGSRQKPTSMRDERFFMFITCSLGVIHFSVTIFCITILYGYRLFCNASKYELLCIIVLYISSTSTHKDIVGIIK